MIIDPIALKVTSESRLIMAFVLDSRIEASSHPVARLQLCEARLQDDARFPWIVLAPRRSGLIEMAELSPREQARLWSEVSAAGRAVRAVGEALRRPVFKLNHGQLGNVVAQLHVHIIGRRMDDAAWPAAVWGSGDVEPYSDEGLGIAISVAQAVFNSMHEDGS